VLVSRRTELGLSRRQLAERAGLSYPFVSELERGAKSPSAASLVALARALELSPAQLLTRAEQPPVSDRQTRTDRPASRDADAPDLVDLTALVRGLVRDELTSGAPDGAATNGAYDLTIHALRLQALDTLRSMHGPDLELDDEGDIPLPMGEVMVFVRAIDDPISLLVMAPVLVDVDDSAALVDRLNEINAGVRFVRFCWVRRSVVADIELFADPFVPEHLEPACHAVGRAAEQFLGDLQADFGGEPFLGGTRPGPPPVARRGTAGYL